MTLRTPCSGVKEKGLVLLILLSVLILALSTVIIANISLNKRRALNNEHTIQVVQQAQQALYAYALVQPVIGTLPCPDNDFPADGLENRVGNDCAVRAGWLPYRSLGMDDLQDSGGSSLWYAVPPAYTASAGVSRNASIVNHYSLDSRDVAGLVIAPGRALQNQQRNAFDVNDYLEGENANATIAIYAQDPGEQNNDVLLGLGAMPFWNLQQKKVLGEVASLLLAYKTACGEYPWAADFTAGADNSIANRQAGSVPLDNALPQDWNTACALGIEPSDALRDHWRDQLYFHFCLLAEGNCLQLNGDSSQQVMAILIAPGIALAGQDRSSTNLVEFFEDENVDGAAPYKYLRPSSLDTNFNDMLHVVEP